MHCMWRKKKTFSFLLFFYNILSNIFVYKVSKFHGILKIFHKKCNVNIKHLNRGFMGSELDGQFDHLENDTSI